jgi:hypothetical protein
MGVFVMRPKKEIVKSGTDRQGEWRQRRELGLHARCRVTRYSAGTSRYMTPGIRGEMICMGVGLNAFLKEFGTNHFIGKECKNPHRFMSQLCGMPPGKAFDKTFFYWVGSRERASWYWGNGNKKKDASYDAVCRWWRWPHRKRQPIELGHIPADHEHRQRWIRLGWKRPGFKLRCGHKSQWRKKPHKERHRWYRIDALADICQMLTRRSGRLLSDEARDAYASSNQSELTGEMNRKMIEAHDENVGVFTELFSQPGMRSHASFGRAHCQRGEPGPVTQKEFDNFEQTSRRLQVELWERAPPLKPLKKYRAPALPLRLAA